MSFDFKIAGIGIAGLAIIGVLIVWFGERIPYVGQYLGFTQQIRSPIHDLLTGNKAQ